MMLELSKLPNTADNATPHMLRYGETSFQKCNFGFTSHQTLSITLEKY